MLLDWGQIVGFLLAAMAITISPGPDNLMVLGLGLSQGRRRGMAFGLGCALGCLSHTALAALGLSAAIAASVFAFTALKICGGLYLVWLGVRAVRRRGGVAAATAPGRSGSPRSQFVKGLLANAINPKVILFFLAFLPQFVVRDNDGIAVQVLQLGVLFTVQAAVLFTAIGWFSGHLGGYLGRTPRAGVWLDRLAGSIFLMLGAKLIVSR
jgi:threonine/homoserine/homoserine lactone efflux protein